MNFALCLFVSRANNLLTQNYVLGIIADDLFWSELMKKSLYASIFLLSLAGLALENSLTRIFSITMWYHYAFMAISVAMLGMRTGAVKVFVSGFSELGFDESDALIARYSRYFSVFTILSILTLLSIPFVPRDSGTGIFSMALIYSVAAVPFYFTGVAIALLLSTKYMEHANRLYASDLAGAAVGSLAFFIFLSGTDAVTFIILLSCTGFFSAYLISKRRIDMLLAVLIVLLALINHNSRLFKIEWTKVDEGVTSARIESGIEWESWTPFSRITVYPGDNIGFGWGISTKMMSAHPDYRIDQKVLQIDSAAATVITKNQMPVEGLIHLKYDITNFAHYLFPNSKVGVIGVGGGRDILSALQFGQREVWGIEINPKIIKAVTEVYNGYTYDFTKLPNVHIVSDEARNFFERSDQKFDIIQASLIDSWAATASGAFVLTENTLYTVDAWKAFFSKLTDNGALTMSRWYYPKRPGELLRLTNLAYQALIESGVKDPSKHILLTSVNYFIFDSKHSDEFGTGTIIVSKKPFKENIIDRFITFSDLYGFEAPLAAGREKDSDFKKLVTPSTRDAFISNYELDISAPTDDSPFFFNMLKPASIIKNDNIEKQGPLSTNLMAVKNLLFLLAIVIILSVALILVPLILKMKESSVSAFANVHSLYFASIGTGFMLIEIALIQKFAVFLGHPTYSILVVLFTVLLFCGLGSFVSGKFREKAGIAGIFILLITVTAIAGTVNMYLLPHFSSWTITARIIYSFTVMAFIGFVLGMPFPTGLAILSQKMKEKAPWLWGINGATSVVSSVLAITISIFFGISSTFWTGFSFYLIAFASALAIERRRQA